MKEIRFCEIRAAAPAGAESLTLVGRPIVYDVPAVINDQSGSFTEIIRRGALDAADLSNVRLLYNHDTNRVPLARTPKTMRLTVSPAGLEMAAELPDTETAREVHTAVCRGDLSGMSFAFVVLPGGDRWDLRTRTREIFRIKKILEVSIVPFPAYEAASVSVEARAAMQALDCDKRKQAIIAANKILTKRGF